MPFQVELPQTLTQRVAKLGDGEYLAGMWVCSGSPVAAEIAAASGMQWVLIDAEHSPIDLQITTSLLQAMNGYPATPVVRVPVNDQVLIKQYLDLGAQNLLVPMIDTPSDAEAAVRSVYYPPRGVRGVGSALARASRWNAVPNYLARAEEFVSLTVQIESATAVDNAAEIAAVDGIDAVFVGPSDLAASMGLLGQQTHPDVTAAVLATFDAVKAAGKLVGVNAFDPEQARKYLDAGASFVLVGADVGLMMNGARAWAETWVQH
ncbi:MAG: HpcH/HpaI aldolase/citrate lyase family protein [Brevibacterium sp.]|uniref:HpcH/HpaI aldolase family protein n=1 Tax=Brevibacterium sp. TaxID=1701 RepID=UPI0026497AAB|nr:HpcH/HpaI aldolase/citrate lyase family protein [Brevibacterium sp.]MDN5833902.1 HpcH/HpaI aldolase/citrate lyase family protein [Brevibacterium sp.]MDN5877379.1 HpcH/HpaI aldolase/citrate lyase family protein [Brevibacterium sp.]MDN5908946.1 HpcH/HpaI aldolase/citrate lyase family protein [Brevibacterium sp.]MDN6132528.1 HpcH/HpaI aldolase/citrate lyase family protein [Brevibacterium sp.]MDN6158874.1 HpcH/HpaI aldolase/citrate lyase family protein [Brevibacterium sp.]